MKLQHSATIMGLAIALVLGTYGLAHAKYGAAGCGLGSVIIKSDGIVQIFAATTNGTFGTQTFGITSGTSNCGSSGAIVQNKQKEAFAEATLPRLTRDMAAGDGEYLDAFAELFGCSKDARTTFKSVAKSSYGEVYPNTKTSPGELVARFRTKVAADPTLMKSCSTI